LYSSYSNNVMMGTENSASQAFLDWINHRLSFYNSGHMAFHREGWVCRRNSSGAWSGISLCVFIYTTWKLLLRGYRYVAQLETESYTIRSESESW